MFKDMAIMILCLFMVTFLLTVKNSVYGEDDDFTSSSFTIIDEQGNSELVEVSDYKDESTTRSALNTAISNGYVRFKSYASIGGTISYKEMDSGRSGYFNSNMASDAAYIASSTVSGTTYYIVKLAGVVMRVPASSVKSINEYSDGYVSYYKSNGTYLLHYFSYINGSQVALSSQRVGYAPSYLTANTKYYSYDGHYFYKSFSTMIGDYQNYAINDYSHAINKSNPYYNYYQYLSLRSKTTLNKSVLNGYITNSRSKLYNSAAYFMNAQNNYGVNALLMFSISCNETASGTSNIAINKNNMFGLNAYDSHTSSASVFNSVEECVNDFASGWMSKGYLNGGDSRYRGPHLGDKQSGINVKYASDPYWGEKAACKPYYMTNAKSDYQAQVIGISNVNVLGLYKEASNSQRIYTTDASNGTIIYNYPLLILGKTGSYFMVQSDMPLKSDRSARNLSNTYNFSRDYVYGQKSYIDQVIGSAVAITNMTSIDKAQISNMYDSYLYIGSAIKPLPAVKVNGTTLTKDKDYTLSYSANVEVGTATITISGKGNYSGSVKKTFKIVKNDIKNFVLTVGDQTYSGKALKPAVTVKSGSTLIDGTNYSLAYTNNTNVGTATITVSGKNNLSGSTTLSFKINSCPLDTVDITNVYDSYLYIGSAIKPLPKVKVSGNVLTKDKDYTLSYSSNVEVGIATITISGKGNYSGNVKKTFKIVKNDIKNFTLTVGNQIYSSQALKPAVNVKSGSTLINSSNYSVTYKNNTKVGTATVTLIGKNNLKGTATTTFKILNNRFSKAVISNIASKYVASGRAIKPLPTIKINGTKLKNGTDYTLAYKNNTTVGKATLTIKGKGKYAGESITKSFIIIPKQVSWNSLKSSSNSLSLSYKKVPGASGYRIGYATKEKGNYTYKTSTSLTPTIKNLKRKTTYYVKVQAYKTIDGKNYYGKESWTLMVKTK